MALVKINGRPRFFDTTKFEMRKVSAGKWAVEYDGGSFTIVGGRQSGGSPHEWFCYHPVFYGETWVSAGSMIRAIELGVVY